MNSLFFFAFTEFLIAPFVFLPGSLPVRLRACLSQPMHQVHGYVFWLSPSAA
jgi:hypothetical protein